MHSANIDKDKVTIVIPTLNEREAIGLVIDEFRSYGYTNILVVDGGSTDGTVDVVKSKGVRLVIQDGKGKAAAIATAFRYVDTPYVLVVDGDYTYPARFLDDMLRVMEERQCDEVIGVRAYGEGHTPVFRFGNAVLTRVFNFLFGTKLRDVLSGMYLLRRDSVADLLFETRGFSIESEIAAHIVSVGGKICEVPIEYRKRVGKKKLGVRHGFRIALDMVRLAYRYNPISLLLPISILFLLLGLGLCAYVALHYFMYGIKHYVKGLMGLGLLAIGTVGTFISLLSIYLKRLEMRIYRRMREFERALRCCVER